MYLGSIKRRNSETVYHIHQDKNGYRVNRISGPQAFSKPVEKVPAFVQKYILEMEQTGPTNTIRYQ